MANKVKDTFLGNSTQAKPDEYVRPTTVHGQPAVDFTGNTRDAGQVDDESIYDFPVGEYIDDGIFADFPLNPLALKL